MKLGHIYVFLLLMWGLASSCIGEDYSDCNNRYVVNLSYLGDSSKEIFPDKINRVHMYVFDKENTCIYQTGLTEDEVRSQRTMLPPLDEGDYRLVFLGNPHHTAVNGLSDCTGFEDIVFGSEDYWNGAVVSGNDSLYLASVRQTILPFSSHKQVSYTTAYFAASHYDISVEVVGVPSAPKIVLTGVSPYTDFNNEATCDAEAEYVLETEHDGASKATAKCNILRHLDHENVYLKVLDAEGNEMASVNFKEFLQENSSQIDCSKNEVHIPFKIEFKSLSDVVVTLPDWWVMHVHPDFGV